MPDFPMNVFDEEAELDDNPARLIRIAFCAEMGMSLEETVAYLRMIEKVGIAIQ